MARPQLGMLRSASTGLIEPANLGVDGQGFGLAAHLKGVETEQLNPLSTSSTSNRKRSPSFVNFDLNLSREHIGIDGRRRNKQIYSYTNDEIRRLPPLKSIKIEDFLPNSLLKRR